MKTLIFLLSALIIFTGSISSQQFINCSFKSSSSADTNRNSLPVNITVGGGVSLNGIFLLNLSMEPVLFNHLYLNTGIDFVLKNAKNVGFHFIPTYGFSKGTTFMLGAGVTFYPSGKQFAPTVSIRQNFAISKNEFAGVELRWPWAVGAGSISLPQFFIHFSFDPLKK